MKVLPWISSRAATDIVSLLTKRRKACPICYNLDLDLMSKKSDTPMLFRRSPGMIELRIKRKSILEANERGCQGCRLLSQIVDFIIEDTYRDALSRSTKGDVTNGMKDLTLQIDRNLYDDKRLQMNLLPHITIEYNETDSGTFISSQRYEAFSLSGSPSQSSLWSAIGNGRLILDEALSDERIATMKMWLESCKRNHPECQFTFSTKSTLLPDRVLYVHPAHDIRLHINSGKDTGRYAALSHCWGGEVALQTTNYTIDSFRNGIPLNTLPKNFQDAIMVCRALEIDYLWIDSLCIIQDSKDDWAEQALKMDAVYFNCFVTIAADAAKNSTSGFLATQAGQNYAVYVRRAGHLGTGGFRFHYWSGSDKTYLKSRGWVLQETILPCRVLHFTAEEVAWQCATGCRCECQLGDLLFKHEVNPDQAFLFSPRSSDHRTDWNFIVKEYSNRSFSHDSDRLVALAGIAIRAKQYCPGVRYLAGIWEDDLIRSLLWSTDRSQRQPSRRIDPPIAPSWSWASVTGAVITVDSTQKDVRSKLHNLSAELPLSSGGKEYQTAAGASITLSGQVFRVALPQANAGIFKALLLDLEGITGHSCQCGIDTDDDMVRLRTQPQDQYLAIYTAVVWETFQFNHYMLLLRQVSQKEQKYERIGHLKIHIKQGELQTSLDGLGRLQYICIV
ncbi:heterokaryon incompatibility protein-domain-containing protein [Hypoxylon crocopeplum]|nr:heterokaryon incompatibility protein-domain-containing protein [Hypoxylon crocopeplum]